MKALRLLLLILALFAGNLCGLAADYKVVDRSSKNAPEWLYDLPKGTILVELERPDLGQAQSAAELELKRRIISSVATNISHSTSHEASHSNDGEIVSLLERFDLSTTTNTATLPFLKGISLSRAKGTYWELREEKKTGRRYVVFSVCYPLSESELDRMTTEFEKNDRAKSEELASLRSEIGNVTSSDEIQDAIGRLEALQAYFFDNVRLAEAKSVEKSYKELYKGLTMKGEFVAGELVINVLLNGRPFKVTARPECKSNCASGLVPTHIDEGYTISISYNTVDCISDEENWIDVSLRIKGARLHEKFIIP